MTVYKLCPYQENSLDGHENSWKFMDLSPFSCFNLTVHLKQWTSDQFYEIARHVLFNHAYDVDDYQSTCRCTVMINFNSLRMLSGLSGKLAIVAGAGSGIGRAVALKLVANDCRVGLFDLSEEGLAFLF